MSFEGAKAAIAALLDEIVAQPHDRHQLQERLREHIEEVRGMGQTPPADLIEFERWLERDLQAQGRGAAPAPVPDDLHRRLRDVAPGPEHRHPGPHRGGDRG